jgi:exonuclease VII large subunit
MNPDIEQLAQLISGVSESLHREMHVCFTRMNERFDLIETRMNRQGALIQTGSRWTTRMAAWSERIDRLLSERDKKIADLEQRIHNLEQKRNGHV